MPSPLEPSCILIAFMSVSALSHPYSFIARPTQIEHYINQCAFINYNYV